VLLCDYFLLHRVIISSVLLYDNFLLHRVSQSFARSYTELLFPPYYFMIIFCCTEFHRVLHGVTQSFFSLSYYFMIIFCCTEFHRVLHGVTQSFFSLSYYFMIIFCCTDSRRVLLFPLCYSVVLCETFFYCT